VPRPFARGRMDFATGRTARGIPFSKMRQLVARGLSALFQVLSLPAAALASAIAAVVFAVLLPICGIASVAEGISRVCWDHVREGMHRPRRGGMPHN